MSVVNSVSAVIPIYNSQQSLPGVVNRLQTVLASRSLDYEIVLVNDASTDDSWQIINTLHAEDSRITGINLTRNFGQYRATVCGIKNARHNVIITLDDDGQDPPEVIIQLLDMFEKASCDAIFAVPTNTYQGFIKTLGSRFVEFLFHLFLDKPTSIRMTSFRLLGPICVKAIREYQGPTALIPAIILASTQRIGNLSMNRETRKDGQSGYNLRSLVRITLDIAFYNSTLPLRIVSVAGLIVMGFCFFGGLYIFIRTIITRPSVAGWASLWVLMSFSMGMVFLLLGILSEYIGRLVVEHSRSLDTQVREILR